MEFRPFVDFIHFVGWGLDPSWDPSTLNKFDPCWVRPRCGMGLDPSWGPSTLWTYLSFLPLSGPSTLRTGVLTLGGVRPLCGLFTLVRSVHVVDWGLEPPWCLSTLWTYLSFLPLSGPSTLWTGVLTLGRVRPLYGLLVLGSVH